MADPWPPERTEALFAELERHLQAAVHLRHQLHANPRLSGEEDDTTHRLLAALKADATPLETGGALVRVGDPDGPPVGPVIGLRAEMDALPVEEQTDVPWRSTSRVMHACGHDVHLAAAYAVARTLQELPGPLPLLLVLQPREETYPSGGEDIARSPELAAHDVRAFLGVHVQPRLAQGRFSSTPGPVNAASDRFSIVVTGRPGHAAYPHLTADPVVATADLIGTLQHLVSRQVDPTHPTVLTVGSIQGGNAPNVVPATVQLQGTLRTFDEHDRTQLHASLDRTATAIADVHGCDAETHVTLGAPVLDNDVTLATAAAAWIERAGFTPAPPLRSCGADDFSFYCPLFPSLMVFVGVGSGAADAPGLHHPRFLPSDESVGEVARVMLAGYLAGCATVLDR